MSVKIKIFYSELQRLIGNPESVSVNGKTVGECLHDLVKQHPDVKKLLFKDNGQLLEKVFVFVNNESIYKADLNKAVTDTDTLILTVMLLGG